MTPTQLKLLIAAAVLAAACAASAGAAWVVQGWRGEARVAALVAEHARQRELQQRQLADEEAALRKSEALRALRMKEVYESAQVRSDRRASDGRRAGVAGGGLRTDAAAFAAPGASPGPAAPAAECRAADARAAVLAQLLADVELAGREMARVADEARDAGAACVAAYEALTPKETP